VLVPDVLPAGAVLAELPLLVWLLSPAACDATGMANNAETASAAKAALFHTFFMITLLGASWVKLPDDYTSPYMKPAAGWCT
jgi:hypothetical protein